MKYLTNSAKISNYKLDDKFGLDLYADSDYLIKPGSKEFISTGISLTWIKCDELEEDPGNFNLKITSARTDFAIKKSIIIEPSIVNFEYFGEIKIILFNRNDKDIVIKKGDRIAQANLIRINRFI